MALFRRDYNKPGPGVEKDEAPSPGYIQFFKLIFRNFNKMIGYSLIYFALILPLICFAYYFITVIVDPELFDRFIKVLEALKNEQNIAPGEAMIYTPWSALIYTLISVVPVYIALPLVLISAVLIGPMTCGLTYCMRNHARQEHVWFTDVFVRAWKNKWQGLFFGLLDIALTLSVLIYLFGGETLGLGNFAMNYLKYLAIAIYLAYLIMRWYIYQMAVTFNLTIRGLLKNAWMFVILGLGRNLIAFLGSFALLAFFIAFPIFYPDVIGYVIGVMAMIFWALFLFLPVFATYPVMHRYLVAPALEEQRKKEKSSRSAAEEGEAYNSADPKEDEEREAPEDEE